MNPILRIVLIAGAIIALAVVVRSVKKSRLTIADSVYWVVCAVLLLIFAAFPGIAFFFSNLLGFLSPSNFVFCLIIMLMLIKLFTLAGQVSRLQNKLESMSQEIALSEKQHSDQRESAR